MKNLDSNLKSKLLPLILLIVVFAVDQITKMLIVRYLPLKPGLYMTYGPEFLGDFLRIVHVRNTGAAFSFGANWPVTVRRIFLAAVPAICLIALMVYYFKTNDLTKFQRWMISGIVGGGFGNVTDRVFRAQGVVDFIDVKVYGFLGHERWPTFNAADSFIVVCGIALLLSIIIPMVKDYRKTKKEKQAKAGK